MFSPFLYSCVGLTYLPCRGSQRIGRCLLVQFMPAYICSLSLAQRWNKPKTLAYIASDCISKWIHKCPKLLLLTWYRLTAEWISEQSFRMRVMLHHLPCHSNRDPILAHAVSAVLSLCSRYTTASVKIRGRCTSHIGKEKPGFAELPLLSIASSLGASQFLVTFLKHPLRLVLAN